VRKYSEYFGDEWNVPESPSKSGEKKKVAALEDVISFSIIL